MARTTSIGLYVWDAGTDSFNHTQLAANWDTITSYLSSFDATTKLPKRINTSTTIPGSGTAGDLLMLTAANGGFGAYTLFKYDGTNYRPVGYETLSAVPSSGNFAGRIVLLSASSGGFNQWDLIKYNGTSWSIIGGLASFSSGGGALNISGLSNPGDLYFTSGSRGPVLTDRTTGLLYRIYIDNANISVEKVT